MNVRLDSKKDFLIMVQRMGKILITVEQRGNMIGINVVDDPELTLICDLTINPRIARQFSNDLNNIAAEAASHEC